MSWHINLLTLFPEMFPGALGASLSGKALDKNLWSYTAVNIRDHATGTHKTVDDTPFGGGAGMVMRADVIERALLSLPTPGRKIYLSPRGQVLTQTLVKELSQTPTLTLLCGRYEGVDQRVLDAHEFEEISIGDYILSGGEPAALILMDACIRLLPGVMGNVETAGEESHANGLLEYPHYTRPAEWTAADGQTYAVPPVLTSGDHGKVAEWRHEQAEQLTRARRPDLLSDRTILYVSHSTALDNFYGGLKKACAEFLPGITLILPHENSPKPFPTKSFFTANRARLLVLAEGSAPSTGSGIELGWANDLHIPIIGCHQKGSQPSASLKTVTENFISYSDHTDLARHLAARLF